MKNEPTFNNSETDWARIHAMREEDIDLSDSPELTPEMFAKAIVRRGLKPRPKKVQFTLRVEEDVLAWFRSQGAGYQTQMNDLLRAYMEAQTRHIDGQPIMPHPSENIKTKQTRKQKVAA